ncbi:MAG: hypothetical protein SF053_21955 [Bacteroidia bacterium]|nr:hypothetical protein [Bacteroidia bacterium]
MNPHLCLGCLLLLGACSPRFSNMQTFPISHDTYPRLALITAHQHNRIALIAQDNSLIVSTIPIGALSEYVAEAILSPDGDWLAVISVGEGHPILDVYAVHRLVEAIETDDPELGPVRSVNPYPGVLADLRWTDEGVLMFSANVNFDCEEDRELGWPCLTPDDAPIVWQYDPATDRLYRSE